MSVKSKVTPTHAIPWPVTDVHTVYEFHVL